MTIFRLKQLASTSVHAAGAMLWNYDRAELIADGVVHGIGVFCGLVAVTVLIVLTAVYATAFEVVAVSVYAAGLLAMLVLSATYNLWPVSRAKWVLRRFDHSAIYVLIAATYTPIFLALKDNVFAIALLIGVWCVAIVGRRAEAGLAGPLRPALGRALPRDGLERLHGLGRPWWRRCRRWPCGSSPPAACSIVSASSFMRGSGCVSRTRSGIVLCCSARPAITLPCSIWY